MYGVVGFFPSYSVRQCTAPFRIFHQKIQLTFGFWHLYFVIGNHMDRNEVSIRQKKKRWSCFNFFLLELAQRTLILRAVFWKSRLPGDWSQMWTTGDFINLTLTASDRWEQYRDKLVLSIVTQTELWFWVSKNMGTHRFRFDQLGTCFRLESLCETTHWTLNAADVFLMFTWI